MRRLLLGISAVALALWALLVGGAPAMAADTTIGGVIKSDQEAVPGVTVNVSDETGFVENAISDEKGRWRVVVPQAGTYTVLIETDTLPPGVSLRDPDRTSVEVTVGEGQTKSVLFPTGDAPVSSTSKLDQALQLTVDGFIFGLTIALAAVGLSLIFGTTGLTNFSHGELVTFGSLMAYFFSAIMGLPFIVAAAAAVFAGGSSASCRTGSSGGGCANGAPP